MITNLIRSVTPSKAKSKDHQSPKDDDGIPRKKQESKGSGIEKRITQTTLSYAGAAKQGKNNDDPNDDEMTDDTSKTTIHDEDQITPPKPNADSPDGEDRKRTFRTNSPKKGQSKSGKKTTKSTTLNTKVWLNGPTLGRVQKETDGAPRNLSTSPGNWMQGYDICAAGFKCCVRQSVKLSTKNRCARCGWCLHKDCGLPIQQSRQQIKDNVFKLTETVNAVCLLCINTHSIKVDKPGSSQEHVSTKYETLKQSIRFDWGEIKLCQYKGCLANRKKKPTGPQFDAATEAQAQEIDDLLHTKLPEANKESGIDLADTQMDVETTQQTVKPTEIAKASVATDDDDDDDTVLMGNEQEDVGMGEETGKTTASEIEPTYFNVQLNLAPPTSDANGKVTPKETLKALSEKL
jgi:hypothetical protein